MADKKISQLTGATTPLAGTEVLPIVQSGSTVKVSAADVTSGRAVSALTYTSTATTGTAPLTVSSTTQVANLNAATAGTADNLKSNATTGVVQVVGPAAASTRVMTVPDANFTAARTDAAQTFTGDQTFGSNVRVTGSALPTISGTGSPRAIFLGNTLLISGSADISSPYSQNIQFDIVWGNWGANPSCALVDISVGLREFAGTSGCVFGKLFATGSAATFSSFDTTNITTSQAVLTATSPSNYTLRITVNPTSGTDRFGYFLTIPTSAGGTGTSVTSVTVSLV